MVEEKGSINHRSPCSEDHLIRRISLYLLKHLLRESERVIVGVELRVCMKAAGGGIWPSPLLGVAQPL